MKKVPVQTSEQSCDGGRHSLGIIELSRPETLNALNTECYEIIERKLVAWQKATQISAILIWSSNEKAFCAGGDVKSVVLNCQSNNIESAEDFFTREYFVDYLIYKYRKPIITFADGITMGGGMGLIQGASHRLVTERTVMAMPEVAIGLFPDVGATRFLSELPQNFGLFLGLTGARISGADAQTVGLADFYVSSQKKAKIVSDLIRLPWVDEADQNRNLVTHYFHDIQVSTPEAKNFNSFCEVAEVFKKSDYDEVQNLFLTNQYRDDFLKEAQRRFALGSPLSRQLFFKAYQDHRKLEMREVFCREWDMAVRACMGTEFPEGVRALLIDKDQKPQWSQPVAGDLSFYFSSGRAHLLRKKFFEFFD